MCAQCIWDGGYICMCCTCLWTDHNQWCASLYRSVLYECHIDIHGMTPFIWACYNGHILVLDWLASHGLPSPEMTRASMQHIWCVYGIYECVCVCVCWAMALDNLGMSPFMWASRNGHVPVLDWLLVHGVPISEMSRPSKTSILHMYLKLRLYFYVLIQLRVRHQSCSPCVHTIDHQGVSPFLIACTNGCVGVATVPWYAYIRDDNGQSVINMYMS